MHTVQDKDKGIDTDSDEYESETFSEEKDILDSSYSDFDKAKKREILFKSGSKNYSAYIKEVEKKQILPRRMGFQSPKEHNGNMFLKSFYIGNTYADPFSKGIKGKEHLFL